MLARGLGSVCSLAPRRAALQSQPWRCCSTNLRNLMSSIVKVFVVSSPPSLVNPWQNRMQKQGTGTGFIIDVNTSVGDRGAQLALGPIPLVGARTHCTEHPKTLRTSAPGAQVSCTRRRRPRASRRCSTSSPRSGARTSPRARRARPARSSSRCARGPVGARTGCRTQVTARAWLTAAFSSYLIDGLAPFVARAGDFRRKYV